MQFLNENSIQFTDITTVPVSVLTAEITTIIEELPLLDRGLFSFRTEGLSYLFDLSSIGYHYVNICKLKCNWKHYFVRMSKPTVCCVASLVALCLPQAKLRWRLCLGMRFPVHDEAVVARCYSKPQRASAVHWRQSFTTPEPEGNIRL